MQVYQFDEITLGDSSHSSGHETYRNAVYQPSNKKIIYKKNKHGNSRFSRLEMSFSQLALLFLSDKFTAPQTLVKKGNEIVGLAVEHLGDVIARTAGLDSPFYTLSNPSSASDCKKVKATSPEDIPYYFLDKLPQGFYANLAQAEKDGYLSIDYDSLANILATSYTLEEDDLHKGNFGFYLIEKEGKPQAVFFKIDHDLMFVDSIMGFCSRRLFHLLHGAGAFHITTEDLKSLVCLKTSSNSYWPTKFGYISNPLSSKDYHNFADIKAFSDLARNEDFIRAKWRAFHNHISVSPESVQQKLKECADYAVSADRAHIALMTHATVARLARLRAVLCSIEEFRDSFPELGSQFEKGDTPLHTAIKLGEYRQEETLDMLSHFINVKNNKNQTPLDIAYEKKDYLAVKHLLEHGAKGNGIFNLPVIKNPYLDHIKYDNLNEILRDIGENYTYSLKFKKNLALECVTHFINQNKNKPDLAAKLIQLKKDTDGGGSPELQYIRQLRTKLWFIRQLRGLYGLSTTQWEINNRIDQAIKEIQPKEPGCFSFFYYKDSQPSSGTALASIGHP